MCRPDSASSADQTPAAATVVSVGDRVAIEGFPPENIPLGVKVPFDTEIFSGVFYIRLRNAPSPDEDGDRHSAYFEGKKRFYQVVTQGRFKRSGLNFSDILLGGVFEKKMKGMPPAALFRAIRAFMETVSPGIVFDIAADRPKVLSPLGACQTMSVDLPGDEPTDFNNIVENNALLGTFASAGKRRKMLSKPKTAKGYRIDPENVYTFECYDDTGLGDVPPCALRGKDEGRSHASFGRAKHASGDVYAKGSPMRVQVCHHAQTRGQELICCTNIVHTVAFHSSSKFIAQS